MTSRKQSGLGVGKVAIGCVAENHPKFLSQALRLLQSIRWFGGRMAGANCFVGVVDSCQPEYRHEFERLGAFVRTVPRLNSPAGPSNKLRFLEFEELRSYDTVLMLDCDTLVVQDPWPWLDGEVFQSKIADLPTMPQAAFERLFRDLGLPLPEPRHHCNPSGVPTIWYCNTGVLVFPKAILPGLSAGWQRYNRTLLDRLELIPAKTYHFLDQTALTLAYAEQPVPYRELPLSMNFPLHMTHLSATQAMLECDPVIMHYHWCVDGDGYLEPSPFPGAQKRIGQFNARLKEERRRRFPGRLFWDYRYAHASERGSERGSRDETAAYKQELLGRLVAGYRPKSILDVGCGDQSVTRGLSDQPYTGVDVSSVVIEKNRSEYPKRRFVHGDVLELDCPQSEMVLCLDVLIHIDRAEVYRAMVRQLVALTGGQGVVTGYESAPPIRHDITFYHEPLSESLRRAGARNLRNVGAYGSVSVLQFEPPGAPTAAPKASAQAAGLEKPVFIVGCMRSGTTLLAELLGSCDGVAHCPFELKEIWSKVGGIPMASAKTRERHCPELGAEDVQPGQAQRLAQAFLDEMRKSRKSENGETFFLNKNPHLCNKLPLVAALFPDARFIAIHRELPRVVASLKRLFEDVCRRQQTWHYWPEPQEGVATRCWQAFHDRPPPADVDPQRCFPGGKLRYLAEYWLETNRAVARFRQGLPRERFLQIREEDLIERPAVELARCLAFLRLPLVELTGIEEVIDGTRNELWSSELSAEELTELSAFAESRGHARYSSRAAG